jgi:stringent starvation protein B
MIRGLGRQRESLAESAGWLAFPCKGRYEIGSPMGKSRLPPKKDVALALLESSTVFVHLDPRADGVTVPPWFKKQPQLVLQIGLNMPVPIPDLSLDGEGVSCTLSFNRSPQFCNVPWKAIYALVGEDGRGMVWPEDVPPEVAAQTRRSGDEPKHKKKKKAHLRAVDEKGAPLAVASRRPKSGKYTEGTEAGALEKRGQQADQATASTPPSGSSASDSEGVAELDQNAAPSSKRKLPPYLRVVK